MFDVHKTVEVAHQWFTEEDMKTVPDTLHKCVHSKIVKFWFIYREFGEINIRIRLKSGLAFDQAVGCDLPGCIMSIRLVLTKYFIVLKEFIH